MRVIIADDEVIIRLDLQEMLRELGHQVVASAPNGAEALEQARMLRPDISILDIRMPVMDGISAAEALRREKICPVILLTAFSDRHLMEKAGRAGVFAYLVKPFSEADIASAMSVAHCRYMETCRLEEKTVLLEQQMRQRKMIERARGRIMDLNGLSEEAAFEYLRKRSRQSGKSMAEVAAEIVAKIP